MNYTELAATDRPPFPFLQNVNGMYSVDPPPDGVLSKDSAMQGYYIKALAAAQRNDPEATISNDSGIAAITAPTLGKVVELTTVMQSDAASGRQTVEQQIDRALGIVAPVAVPTPTPSLVKVLDVPFRDADGKWYKYSGPFEFKVSCPPPASAAPTSVPTAKETKSRTIAVIGRILSAQPPKPQAEVDDFQALAMEVSVLPE